GGRGRRPAGVARTLAPAVASRLCGAASMTAERILVLDGHTNQALASVRALGRAGHWVSVASLQRRPLAAWSRHCQDRFRLAGDTPAAFAALRGWAAARGVGIVRPQRELSCVLCAAERGEWEAAGIVVGCGPRSEERRVGKGCRSGWSRD